MNPRTYVPSLFIDIGEKSHFYTLRQTYLHAVPGEGPAGNAVVNGVYQGRFEERSFHHFNLSQDAAEAIHKATQAAAELAVRFNAPSVDQLSGKLDAVRRATADELATREAHYAQMREEYRQQREEERAEKAAQLAAGVITFGKYTGKSLAEVPRAYLGWVVSKRADFEPESLMRTLAYVIAEKFSHLLAPVPSLTNHLGEVGQRLVLDVEVIRSSSFVRPKFGADWLTETVYITTMITSTGECVIVRSTTFAPEDDAKARIKATVMDHGFYGTQAQTVLQRVDVLGDYGVEIVKAKKARAVKAAPVADVAEQELPF